MNNILVIIAVTLVLLVSLGILLARLQGDKKQLKLKLQEASELAHQRLELLHQSELQQQAIQAQQQALKERLAEIQARLDAKQRTIDEERSRYQQAQQIYQQLSTEHTELKTRLEAKEAHFKEQFELLEQNKTALSKEFELLANRIFEEKGKRFTQNNQHSLDNLLKPFKEQINSFQKRVNEVHDASLQGNTHLQAEIKKVLEIGLQMSDEAKNLTSALKGDSQKRGVWGEAMLERTLELSGLIKNDHYEAQASFKDEQQRNKFPDYLIKLPRDKHIVIDSKVTLNAYSEAVDATTIEQYELAMNRHAQAVKNHIDSLASKNYTQLQGMNSPDFVLMFMPIEPAYIELLKYKPELFEEGYRKGVILVSHTTLIPILRTITNLWQIEKNNEQAKDISRQADRIYESVLIIAERLKRLGTQLNTVNNSYNKVVVSLVGQQGLYGRVDRFKGFSSKALPELEPQYPDIEFERLEAVQMEDSVEAPKDERS